MKRWVFRAFLEAGAVCSGDLDERMSSTELAVSAKLKLAAILKLNFKLGEGFSLAGTWCADLKLFSQFYAHVYSFKLAEACESPL